MNNSITDEELEFIGSHGVLRPQANFARKFELIQRNTRAIEFTFYSSMTTIVYMYGNTIILMQQLGGPQSSTLLHFKFTSDLKAVF